jgi:hypothetical protein
MGFFKNLSKFKFGKIAKNAAKNISEGRLYKGAGFLDKFSGQALGLLDGLTAGGVSMSGKAANSLLGGSKDRPDYKPTKGAPLDSLGPFRNVTSKSTTVQPTMDVNGDGKDDTMKLIYGAAAVALVIYFIKKR